MSMTNASTNTNADNVNRDGHGTPRQIIHMRPMTHTLPAKRQGYTRFVLLSDSHTHTYPVPDGDVLIHAGDLTVRRSRCASHRIKPPRASTCV